MASGIIQDLKKVTFPPPEDKASEVADLVPTAAISDLAPFTYVKDDHIDSIWGKIAFNGENPINLDAIKTLGIHPKYECEIGHQKVQFSQPFHLRNKVLIFAIVIDKGRIQAKLFYRSTSQSYWRSFVCRYHYQNQIFKGTQELSVHLPLKLHLTISAATSKDVPNNLVDDHDLVSCFVPFAKPGNPESIDKSFQEHTECTHVMKEVHGEPYNSPLSDRFKGKWFDPKTLEFQDPSLAPNFDHFQSFLYESCTYGSSLAFIVPSLNQELDFLFYVVKLPHYRENENFVFLAHVEYKKANFNLFCVNDRLPKVFDLINPLYDYSKQIPTAFNAQSPHVPLKIGNDIFKPPYFCAWNYVRELRVIQDFYTHVLKQDVPDIL